MMGYRLNVRFAACAAVLLVLLGGGAHLLHAWQLRRHARDQIIRAEQAQADGDLKEAAASFARSSAFTPADPSIRKRHALLLADQATSPRARQQALAAFRALLPTNGGDFDLRLRAVELAMTAHAPEEAERFLRPALKEHPQRSDLYERLARIQEMAGKFGDAAATYEKTLTLDPTLVRAGESLSRIYRTHLDQPRRSAGVLDRVVKQNPRSAAAFLARATFRLEIGRLDLADPDLIEARKLDEKDADILAASAELARQRGLAEESREYWEKAVAARPDDIGIARGLARSYRELGRVGDAVEAVRRALAKDEDNADLRFLLADLLIDRPDLEGAGREAAKLPAFAKGRKLYLDGRLELARRHPSTAVKLLWRAAAEKDLPNGAALLSLVKAYGEMGFQREQLYVAGEAVRLAGTPDSRVMLARVMVSAGRGAEVLRELRDLATLPSPPEGVWAALARVLLEQNIELPPFRRDWSEVELLLGKATAVRADAAVAAVLRAEMLLIRDRPVGALAALREAREAQPDEPTLWQAQADLLTKLNNAAAARRLLAEADARFDNRLDWLTARAWRLVNVPEEGIDVAARLDDLEKKSSLLTADDRDRLARTLAELYARVGNHAATQRLCEQVLHDEPRDLGVSLLLFHALLGREDTAGAAKVLVNIKKLDETDGVQWRCARAALLLRQGDSRAEARRLLQEAAMTRPGWSQPPLLLAQLDEAERRPAQALANYQRVLALGDYRPLAVRRAAALLLAGGHDADADKVLEQAGRAGALGRDLLRPAADVALRVGRTERAVELARQAVPGKGATYQELIWLGGVLGAAGRHYDADSALEQAATLAPDEAAAWLALIAHQMRQNKRVEAEEDLERLRENVRRDRLGLAVARGYEELGRPALAEREYRRHLTEQPRDAEALQRLADLHIRNHQPKKAERALTALLDDRVLVPEEELPTIRRRLALALASPGRTEDRTSQALTLLAQNGPAREADRRAAELVKGTRPAERTAALKALEALPGGPAVTPQERICLARLYEAASRWPDARRQYAALLATDRDNPAYQELLIEGLLRRNKLAEAGRWLAELKKLEPTSARTKKLSERLQALETKEDD